MDSMLALLAGYLVFGLVLVWISARLAGGLKDARLRAAIPAAVFALWYAPGMAVGHGGAMPAPLLLLFISSTYDLITKLNTPMTNHGWALHVWMEGVFWGIILLAIVWAAAFGFIFGVGWIFRRLRPAGGSADGKTGP